MKRTILLIIFISIVFGVKAQWWNWKFTDIDTAKYVVLYELKFKEDTTNLNYYRTDTYMLMIGETKNINSFYGYKSYKGDMEKKKRGEDGTGLEWIESGGYTSDLYSVHKFRVFKDFNKKLVTTIDYIPFQDMYIYEEPFDSFNWQVTAETDTISNYMCQKAICNFGGRTWVAWFTTEIPISDGPYKFCGLPGLILNIADTQDHYSFKFLSIEKPSELVMVYDEVEERVPTTKDEFLKSEIEIKFHITLVTCHQVAVLSKKLWNMRCRRIILLNWTDELIRSECRHV